MIISGKLIADEQTQQVEQLKKLTKSGIWEANCGDNSNQVAAKGGSLLCCRASRMSLWYFRMTKGVSGPFFSFARDTFGPRMAKEADFE
jgi:hypothetical protein